MLTVFTFYTYRVFNGFGFVWKSNEMLPMGPGHDHGGVTLSPQATLSRHQMEEWG